MESEETLLCSSSKRYGSFKKTGARLHIFLSTAKKWLYKQAGRFRAKENALDMYSSPEPKAW
jgi:hypothetical protein